VTQAYVPNTCALRFTILRLPDNLELPFVRNFIQWESLQKGRSTRSSRHSVMSSAWTLEMRKRLLNFSLAKPRQNAEAIQNTFAAVYLRRHALHYKLIFQSAKNSDILSL
jgi:hypothetical protein